MSNLVIKTLEAVWDMIEAYDEDMTSAPETWTKHGLRGYVDTNGEYIYDTLQKFFKKSKINALDCNQAAVDIVWAFADDALAPDTQAETKDLKKWLKKADAEGLGWCAEVAMEVSDFLKEQWNKQLSKEEKKPEEQTEKKSVGSRVFTRAKSATKKVLVRKVSRKLVGNAHTALVKQLAATERTRQLAAYLDNPMGQALVSGMLALGLETLPLPAAIKDTIDTIKDDLVEEMTIQAFDSATVPVENVMALLLPGIKEAIMPLLSAKEILQLKESND